HPGLKITAARHGYFSQEEEEAIVDEVAKDDPQLVLVALGVPKQEYFIDRWHAAFPRSVMIGVGGSFDIWAGTSRRAPAAMQKLHLEWLYRLMTEPWRWRRMAQALPRFGLQVIADLLLKPRQQGKRSPGADE
ncbi:MAG TPA: WecB/TagA/CpsF family glycosyltransferase, partial [Candidatus Obscuribacterales bacterium]